MKIQDLQDNKDLLLAIESDLKSVREAVTTAQVLGLGIWANQQDNLPDPEDFNGFFVKLGEGEYEEIWGFETSIPWIDKPVTRLL